MKICPQCRRRSDKYQRCPVCRILLVPDEAEQELVSVYEAPDEMAARSVAALLEAQGIETVIKSEQIAMYDGLAMMLRPRWGQVLVLAADRALASKMVEDYLAGLDPDQEAG